MQGNDKKYGIRECISILIQNQKVTKYDREKTQLSRVLLNVIGDRRHVVNLDAIKNFRVKVVAEQLEGYIQTVGRKHMRHFIDEIDCETLNEFVEGQINDRPDESCREIAEKLIKNPDQEIEFAGILLQGCEHNLAFTIDWVCKQVYDKFGDDKLASTEANLDNRLHEVNVPRDGGFPWGSTLDLKLINSLDGAWAWTGEVSAILADPNIMRLRDEEIEAVKGYFTEQACLESSVVDQIIINIS